MKEAGKAIGQAANKKLERLEEKVNDLYAEVETELIVEDAKWDEAAMDKFIVDLQKPTDTIEAIDKVLSRKPGQNR